MSVFTRIMRDKKDKSRLGKDLQILGMIMVGLAFLLGWIPQLGWILFIGGISIILVSAFIDN